MLHGGHLGELELRRDGGGARLRGRFPYNKTAVLSDGGRNGRPRKERIASRAFAFRVDDPQADIHLLVGHSYDTPLASKLTNTLAITDTAEAVTFDAAISPEIASTTYGKDILAMIGARLVLGLSPGFRIPPARTVPNAEDIEDEENDPANGKHRAIIRTVRDALLFELSVVTVPAYPEAQIELRNWNVPGPSFGKEVNVLRRWRL